MFKFFFTIEIVAHFSIQIWNFVYFLWTVWFLEPKQDCYIWCIWKFWKILKNAKNRRFSTRFYGKSACKIAKFFFTIEIGAHFSPRIRSCEYFLGTVWFLWPKQVCYVSCTFRVSACTLREGICHWLWRIITKNWSKKFQLFLCSLKSRRKNHSRSQRNCIYYERFGFYGKNCTGHFWQNLTKRYDLANHLQ